MNLGDKMNKEQSEQRVDTHVIDDMIKKGVGVGAKIEITLTQDAAFYNGATHAPTVNATGYEKFDPQYHDTNDMRPGMTIRGFVYKFQEDRVTLVNAWPKPKEGRAEDLLYRYVQNDVISSYIAEVPGSKKSD